jgi:dTDP-N-acetylfucosamine:lipid II N-acetylfucosaminyltransferase
VVDRAARRADAFSAPIPDDFDVMKARFPQFRGRYAQLNYADISSFTGRVADTRGDVLLGNSAWPANNHLEALERLSTMDLQGRRVLTPLTYGDQRYRDRIVERGRELLGDSFDPLLEPLPFEQYLDRISRCDVVVMNHNRQQGLGNVGIGLYSGAHLFLSPRNPLRTFLERSGLDVLDLGSARSLPVGPVDDDTIRRRRVKMREIWGEDVVLDNVRRLLAGAPSPG